MWRVIEGDALKVLPTLESASVGVVITDLPYSAVTHDGASTRILGGRREGGKRLITTFGAITKDQFLLVCRECVRVARRWVVMTCDWRHAAAAEESGLPVVRVGVWVKPDAAPQFTGDRPGVGWEAVLILHRPGRKRWNRGGHHAVWQVPIERERLHPTQKPYRLIRDWVFAFTDPGETVLDPFAGSGQVGVVAEQEGRNAILIERHPPYVEVIRRRLAGVDSSLFPAATQPELFKEGDHAEGQEAEAAATTHDAAKGRPGPANDRGGPDAGLRDGLPRRDATAGAGVAQGGEAERAVTPGTTPCGIAGALLDGESPDGLALNGGVSPEDAAAAIERTRRALDAAPEPEQNTPGPKRRVRKGATP